MKKEILSFNEWFNKPKQFDLRIPLSDILPQINLWASSDMVVQTISLIVPASITPLTFPELEDRGGVSTGVEIWTSPALS